MQTWRTKLAGSEFKVMRLQEESLFTESAILDTPKVALEYIRDLLPNALRYSPDTENLGVVLLNTRKRVIGMEIVSNGTLNTLLVHQREVFRSAIILGAAGIILFHNHPSGDPTPSEADIRFTRDLMRGGQLLAIDIVDHLILGRKTTERPYDYFSLREGGYFSM